MTRQRPIAGLAVLTVGALAVGGVWSLASTFGPPEAATAAFVAAALLIVGVVGVRSGRSIENPYW
ncbi:hypothetical protein [Natronoarchaeum rubrum]|uniref:hypothetical protein n=1 Tax=Natronoarchaeum rubrum TaxID=755311 RepID=UPI00211330CA|nr:hypothetical protein [Natronoarchaeum rubrum]HMB50321.1 hypothetical protein [Natronoarchaeum rubrum]